MDITWTVIVLASLLQGTQTQQETVDNTTASAPEKSGADEPSAQKQTEPTATSSTPTELQHNQVVSPSQTNPTAPSSQTTPSDSTSIASLIGSTSVTSPTETTSVTSPTETTSVTSPTETTSVTSPTETTSVTSPTETTSITSPTETTSVTSPTETTSVTSPTETTSVTSPTETTSVTSPTETTTITNPTSTNSITIPTDSNLQTSQGSTTGLSPTSTQVMSSPAEPTTVTQSRPALPGDLSTTTVVTTLEESSTKDTYSGSVNPTTLVSTVPHIQHRATETHTSTAAILPDNSMKTSSPETTPQNTSVFDLSKSSEDSVLSQACKTLGQELQGNCSVHVEITGKQVTVRLTINADQLIPTDFYKPLEQKEDISKETIPDTLIAILASCGALVLILCLFAVYCTYHRRSYRKNQQHLTEELQTVENGYHDNPTLEVMEVQPEMQEKKPALNGEFNDSWIVPIDNLLKEDVPEEEDTHL